MIFFSERYFWLLFFAVVRFSPPSQETEAVKRKAEAKNNSPDLQEPTFNCLVAAERSEAVPRRSVSGLNPTRPIQIEALSSARSPMAATTL